MLINLIYRQLYDMAGVKIMIGGVETYIANLISLFKSNGYDVIVYQFASAPFKKEYMGATIIGVAPRNKLEHTYKNRIRCMVKESYKHADPNKDILLFCTENDIIRTKYKKVIAIQHGIGWDVHNLKPNKRSSVLRFWATNSRRAFAEYKQYKYLSTLVCVDYNYVNWYRTCIHDDMGTKQQIKNAIKVVLNKILSPISAFGDRFDYCDYMFERKYLKQTSLVMSKEKIPYISKKFQTVVYGSDQIWAPNVFNDVYMGAMVESRKVSYAASIGLTTIPPKLIDVYSNLLSDFSSVSVREEAGQKLLEDLCGIESKVVLDPTLLIDSDRYAKIEKKPRNIDSKEFVFCYFLNEKNDYHNIINKLNIDHTIKKCGISLNDENYNWMTDLFGIGPREFIWCINHAKYVITDSYHGTIFSLLFHKDFYTLKRFKKDDPVNQNSRIYQLEKWFEIGKRIGITEDSPDLDYKIDYEHFEKVLRSLRKDSHSFLVEALK